MASLVLFILLNVSDWPSGYLAGFWLDHPIVGASLGTLLLIAVGFFAFTYHDRRRQDDLDEKVAAAGRSGVVDHLIDVDVALSLVAAEQDVLGDRWPNWNDAGRPLRWLRHNREELLTTDRHKPIQSDPRRSAMPPSIQATAWRRRLIDQSVRRVAAGLKDWGPLLSRSRSGQRDLIDLGTVRVRLLRFEGLLAADGTEVSTSSLLDLQIWCRQLAWRFEDTGGAPHKRDELVRPEREAL